MNNMFEFTNTYDTNHSYEINENGMCPICNRKMDTDTNKQILFRDGTKNVLMGVGCDHPECGGQPIKFDKIYYKCNVCNLDYCKEHAEKKYIQEIDKNSNLNNTQNYLREEFKSVYKY